MAGCRVPWAAVIAVAACSYHGAAIDDAGTDPSRDAPGTADAVDATPTVDGSPDLDTDGDGVFDATDNCPALPNPDQHDWDADLHGDPCDGCPHLPSTADPDGDGDGVGDDCDPRPGTPGETRAVWLGFYDPADITGWVNTGGNGQWTVGGGVLHEAAAGFSLLDSPASYTDAYFATSLTVTTADTAEIGFCLADVQPGIQYYCCGASNTGGTPTARAASSWATSGGQISVPATFTGANLAVGQHVEMTGTLRGATFECSIAQGATVATPSTTTGDKVGPAVFYTVAPVDYRYIFLVRVE